MEKVHEPRRRLLRVAIHLLPGALMFVSLLGALPGPAGTVSADGCRFIFGFKALHDAIPNVVGDCLVNEHFNPRNGDSVQETTGTRTDGRYGGLLVWRKADNWTAFTDGHRTWINGPYGIQQRLNTERFPWERDSVPAQPAVLAPNPVLKSQCELATFDLMLLFLRHFPLMSEPGQVASTLDALCQQWAGAADATVGVPCFVYAFQQTVPLVGRITSSAAKDLDLDGVVRSLFVACVQAGALAPGGGVAPPSPPPAPGGPPVTGSVIESRIAGDFNGWEGDTVFKLDNGQIWQQASYAYHYHYAYRPEVLIYPSGGGWKMKVEGVEDTIMVRRLK